MLLFLFCFYIKNIDSYIIEVRLYKYTSTALSPHFTLVCGTTSCKVAIGIHLLLNSLEAFNHTKKRQTHI